MKQALSDKGKFAWVTRFAFIAVVALLAFCLAGCSSGGTTGGGKANNAGKTNSAGTTASAQTINGYSVKEYNKDVDTLAAMLRDAQSYYDQIMAMGDPNNFTSQEQVDRYNNLVDNYNIAADAYNQAASEFSKKYKTTVDGAGTRMVNPDQINLPSKR